MNPRPDKKEDQQIRRSDDELKCVSMPYRLAGQGKLSNFLIWRKTHVIPIKFMFAQ